MLGINDTWILMGYILTIGFTLACILYGLLNWNKGGDEHGS
ncbi:symporter small accessory protein [Methanooceanicella nereidis]|nr:symporter small accessory protein [Methanocella sp. CWC-04]